MSIEQYNKTAQANIQCNRGQNTNKIFIQGQSDTEDIFNDLTGKIK